MASQTLDEPFGRQGQPIHLTATGEQPDIDRYLAKIAAWIERGSYDTTVREGNTLTVYPAAVND